MVSISFIITKWKDIILFSSISAEAREFPVSQYFQSLFLSWTTLSTLFGTSSLNSFPVQNVYPTPPNLFTNVNNPAENI